MSPFFYKYVIGVLTNTSMTRYTVFVSSVLHENGLRASLTLSALPSESQMGKGHAMSYDVINDYPENFEYVIQAGFLEARLSCPRCGTTIIKVISFLELREGYEIACQFKGCMSSPTREGFKLFFKPNYQMKILGELDQPVDHDAR